MVDVFFVQFIDGIDVPVIIHRRGLLSVLGNVVDMPVADSVLRLSGGSVAFTQTGLYSANCAKDRSFARYSSWTGWDTRCCTTTGAWGKNSAENCGSSTVAVLEQGQYWIVRYFWGEY